MKHMVDYRHGKIRNVVIIAVFFGLAGVLFAIWFAARARIAPIHVHTAAFRNQAGRLRLMLLLRPDLVNSRGGQGRTPLHMGTRYDVARVLLAHGADVSAVCDRFGDTPLHRAAGLGRYRTVKLLVAHGADPNARCKAGTTPLHRAARTDHVELVNFLIAEGTDPAATSQTGWTPLHVAASMRRLFIIEPLIAAGSPVDHNAPGTGTALHVAAWERGAEVVEALLLAGASPDIPGPEGQHPLHKAVILTRDGEMVRPPDERVIRLLLEHGARPDAQDDTGRTPLDIAQDEADELARILMTDLAPAEDDGE